MIKKLLIYKSLSFNPHENLAVEKYLLDFCPADTLILYLWQNENTVVIGKNQNPWTECKCRELEADGGYLARRLSGGGAVFHDKGNLNFTFITTTENNDLKRNLEIIKKACEYTNIKVEISGRNDILADGRKFSGNAFYNSLGKSYHHGTILINADREKMKKYLTPSKAKLEAKGIKSVKSRTVNLIELSPTLTVESMKEYMLTATESYFKIKALPISISHTAEISELTKKYSSKDWLYGSALPFTASFEGRFDWGSVELRLDIKKGVICSAQVFTDSMDETLAEKLSSALKGVKFDYESLQDSIKKYFTPEITENLLSLLKTNEI